MDNVIAVIVNEATISAELKPAPVLIAEMQPSTELTAEISQA